MVFHRQVFSRVRKHEAVAFPGAERCGCVWQEATDTSMRMQGEVWHVQSSLVRKAPTAGSPKHVLLHAVQVLDAHICSSILPWRQNGQCCEECDCCASLMPNKPGSMGVDGVLVTGTSQRLHSHYNK